MTSMEPITAADAVANGAQLLDERYPGWWRQIDLPILRLNDCRQCVCGQLAADMFDDESPIDAYQLMLDTMGLTWLGNDYVYGFNLTEDDRLRCDEDEIDTMFRELDHEWHQVIVARLRADELNKPTVTKELVNA